MPATSDLQRRGAMRPDPVGLWIDSQTLGTTSTSSTGSDFGGLMTNQIQLAMDCNVSAITYTLSQAGTYQLRIDGVLIDTVSPGSSGTHNLIANVAPIRVARGPHEFKVTKTAGASGWNFRTGNGEGFAPWLSVGYWQEAGGAETPPMTITVVDTARPMLYQYATVSGTSTTPRAHAAQLVTWRRPVEVVGLVTGMDGGLSARYQVAIDGEVRGMTGNLPNGAAAYPAGIITLDRPAVMSPGETHFVDVSIVGGGTFGGAQFFNTPAGPGWASDDWISQGPWRNPGGTDPTSTCLILGWLINPLGP